MPLAAGTRLGVFEILAPLGKGGMGEVYRAKDTKLGREVAVKILPPDMASSPERLARFQREARALAAFDHPGIVAVYSVEESDGIHFLTMQLVEGRSLRDLIQEGGLPTKQLLEVARGLVEAVTAAHDKGIFHRDLKPANVMLTNDGRVKVLDFGLAKIGQAGQASLDSDLETTPETREGAVIGTLPYMSPEQLSAGAVDHRTDIFSLGVLLYEMATGRRPFQGRSSAEVSSAILRDTPPFVTEVRPALSPPLGRIIRRCLEKHPRDRYQTALALFNELRDLRNEAGGAPPAWKRSAWVAVTAALFLGVMVYLAAGVGVTHRASRGPEAAAEPHVIRSIVVLPLDNYSGDSSQDYFAEGMTDELTADLATISRLRVISRGSAMQFKGEHRPPTPEIAETLDVDAIVEGSVHRVGDRVRITAQLIDARRDQLLWAKSFERYSHDVLTLQNELASAIAREIHVQLTPAEQLRLTNAPSVNPEAYDAYLRGRYFFNRPSDENLQKAIARFQEAIRLDPTQAPAFSGLSDAYLWAGYNEGFLTASEARPEAKAAAERAIQLDDESAEAHTSLAVFKLFYEYDWAGCEVEFRKAIALNPNYAFAHDQFGLGLAFQGRLEESIAEGKRAAELDPLSPQVPLDAIFAYAWQGNYQAAREQAKRAADLDPTFFFPPWAFAWINVQAGRLDEAIPGFRKAKAMESPAFVSAWLAYAYGASGDRARAMAETEELKKRSLRGSVTPFNLALVSLGLGDRARALSYLERAYESDSQWLGWLNGDRTFDPLRSEPRFVALLSKLGFDE